jgi:hypothetical protein
MGVITYFMPTRLGSLLIKEELLLRTITLKYFCHQIYFSSVVDTANDTERTSSIQQRHVVCSC